MAPDDAIDLRDYIGEDVDAAALSALRSDVVARLTAITAVTGDDAT